MMSFNDQSINLLHAIITSTIMPIIHFVIAKIIIKTINDQGTSHFSVF